MGKSRMLTAVVTAAALTTLGLVAASSASASQVHSSQHWRGHTLTNEVLAPFQLAVNSKGVYIADGFKNNLSLLQNNVLDRRRWPTRQELRIAIVTWIEKTYHRRRRQDSLGRLTPVEYELIMTTPATQAA